MKKIWKKARIIAFLALVLSSLACFFAACDNDGGDEAVTYTVTVKLDETKPASGVNVKIKHGSTSYAPVTTDADGKAKFELVPDDYKVTLTGLPAGYSVPDDADMSLSKTKHETTIVLEDSSAYKIYLVNPDGTPYYAEDVHVGICTLSGNCLVPQRLASDGVARCEGDPTDYQVQITGLPATVTFERDDTDELHKWYYTGGQLSATVREITIVIYPVPDVTDIAEATPMTDAEKTAYAEKNSAYKKDDLTAYRFTKQLAVGETAYYSFTPAMSGDYRLYKDGDASYLYGNRFQIGNKGQGMYNFLTLDAGVKYYFNVTNVEPDPAVNPNLQAAPITADFVLEFPAATHITITGAGTVDLAFSKAGANAVVELAPTIGSSYKLTALGTVPASIIQKVSSIYAESAEHTSFAAGANVKAKFTEDNIGGSLYFSVAVQSGTSVQIKVEKIAEHKNKTNVVKSPETLTKFADQTDHLTELPYGTELYYNEATRRYHVGDASGAIVVVLLTNKSDRCSLNGELVYLEENNKDQFRKNPYIFDVTSEADRANLEKGNTYEDYRALLRGFADYTLKPAMGGNDYIRPALTENNNYASFVNDDGVYPLTPELEKFLKAFAANNASSIVGATAGNEWQFALYYYSGEAPDPVEQDAIVGSYSGGRMGPNLPSVRTASARSRTAATRTERGRKITTEPIGLF